MIELAEGVESDYDGRDVKYIGTDDKFVDRTFRIFRTGVMQRKGEELLKSFGWLLLDLTDGFSEMKSYSAEKFNANELSLVE